eukprot:6247584-Pyramimonas_sp.AAC.1
MDILKKFTKGALTYNEVVTEATDVIGTLSDAQKLVIRAVEKLVFNWDFVIEGKYKAAARAGKPILEVVDDQFVKDVLDPV